MLERGLRPQLIFSDVVMPGTLSARAMTARAAAMIPGLAVIFASGYTEHSIVHNGQLDPDVHLISKPWRIEDLASRLRLALDLARRPEPLTAGARVLLVDDDALIRLITAEMLSELGYQVVEAEDADMALGLLDRVDLMITDLGLGKMDGLALAAAVRIRLPGLPVIISSGQAVPDSGMEGLLWLSKPYDYAALQALLQQVSRPDGRPSPAARPVVKA
jgi:CheY-like chemotaxis protein